MKTNLLLFILCIAALPVFCVRLLADTDVPTIPRYGLFEVSFHCPDMSGNPFDPAVNDVWATLTGPRGQLHVPAFWDGDGVWKARFCPENVGNYTVNLTRNGIDETANAITPTRFHCGSSTDPGFIRTSTLREQWPRFVFENGQTYFPIGMDAAWGGKDVLDYDQLFLKMTSSRMNFARVWMTFWDGKALDWAPNRSSSPALGTLSLDAARKLDNVLAAAENSGVYVQLTLQHHGQVTRVVNPNWSDSPYNVQNPGGFLTDPDEFFTNPRAILLTENKYRYIVARYAWCPHLLGWEVFNEIQNNPDLKEADYIPWHRTMIAYIRSLDPYHHLITTSYTDPSLKLALETPLDYYQPHTYPADPGEYFRQKIDMTSTVPIFWGEFGAQHEQSEQALHNGLWAGLMVPCAAGAPQFWYWDLVQKNDWWSEFTSAAKFIQQSGLVNAKVSTQVTATLITDSRGPLNLVPGLGWDSEKGDGTVVISPEGAATGMQNIPSFIQGKYHHDMMPSPIALTTNFSSPTTVHVDVATVSAAGADLVLSIDGIKAAELPLPGTGKDRDAAIDQTVSVSAGRHKITIENAGDDWFTMGKIVIDGAAPGAEAMVRGIGDQDLFWCNRVDGADGGPIQIELSIPAPKQSSYLIQFYDTASGTTVGAPVVDKPRDGHLVIQCVLTGKDIAGWIMPVANSGG